ncbi:MAG: hypothetical protein RMX96_04035 [Nostoc sp. ChiSLP02]|nr:hypothetical protein [Nostoc sp. DedSLP01]MDZ8184017.1 hypothetical protein [Nostoc sp. ChiSLP02]
MFNLKLIRSLTIKVLALSTTFFLVGETSAKAQQKFTTPLPSPLPNFGRDLVPSSSQEFFRQGRDAFEREIQILRQRELSSNRPILKVDLREILKRRSTLEKPEIREF